MSVKLSQTLFGILCALGLLICGLRIGVFYEGRLFVTLNEAKIRDPLVEAANASAPSDGGRSFTDRIPCLVHQSWKTQQLPSVRARRWRTTWLMCLPDCKHILWSDEDNLRLVKVHYPWLLPIYERFKSGVQRADVTRYMYMLHYGGIYTDLDTVCIRDFRHLLKPCSLVFGGMEGHWVHSVNGTYVQNSFMASAPGHPFWLGLLREIDHRARQNAAGWSGAEKSTGPLVLMSELEKYLDTQPTGVRIFPPAFFNPFSWMTNRKNICKTRCHMNDIEEAICVATFPRAYVVQMHCKSWGPGKF